MIQHSQCPWERHGIQAGCHMVLSAAGRIVAYFGHQGIDPHQWFADEVDRANAELAVRAPELLDAIKRLLPYAESRAEDLSEPMVTHPIFDERGRQTGHMLEATVRWPGQKEAEKALAAVKDAMALVSSIDPTWTPGAGPTTNGGTK